VVAFNAALEILNAGYEDGTSNAVQEDAVDGPTRKLEDILASAISTGDVSLQTDVLRLLLQVRVQKGEWGTALLLVDRLESVLGASDFLPGLARDEQVHRRWGIRFEELRAQCHHYLGQTAEFEYHAEKLKQLRQARESNWTYEHQREEGISNLTAMNVASLQVAFVENGHGGLAPSGLENQRLLRGREMTGDMLGQRQPSPLDQLNDPVLSNITNQLRENSISSTGLYTAVKSPDIDYPKMFFDGFQLLAVDLFLDAIQTPEEEARPT